MNSKYSFSLYSLKHTSLVLFKEVSDILSEMDNSFVDISKNCKTVIEDNIEEESFRSDVVFVNAPASPDEFAYSIMKFKKNDLLYFRKIFNYSYIISGDEKYKKVVEYIDIILKYRKHQLEDLFDVSERMFGDELDFYVRLIPKDVVYEMADYCDVELKNLSVSFLKEEYNKVKKIRRI